MKHIALLALLLAGCSSDEARHPCNHHGDCYRYEMICEDGWCIPDDGRNRLCETDVECLSGEKCRNGICTTAPDCTSDADCPADHFCHMLSGECRPSQVFCDSDEDCPPGNRCDFSTNVCVPSGCTQDSDCPDGQVCNPVTGTCGADGPECTSDADCMAGQRCDTVAGVCRSGGCISDSDCLAGQYCDHATGVCRTSGSGCTSDADCPSGQWCETSTGNCRSGCRSDADCPSGTTCNVASGACVPTGCVNDSDCPSGYLCQGGQCVAQQGQVPDGSSCQQNSDCQSRNCVPITEPATCLSPCRSSQGCPANHACVEVTSSWYCIHEGLLSQLHGLSIDVGQGGYGAYCSGQVVYNPYCHSMICNQNQNACTMDCTTDSDCPYGTRCMVNYETGIMRAYCFPDVGLQGVGTQCNSDDWCAFNVCLAGYYVCSTGCCKSSDCPTGWACGRIQSSDPYAPGFAKGCAPADWGGSLPTGSNCSSDDQCRSGICLNGTCSDLCCTHQDCPSPQYCELYIDDNNLGLTICQ